MSADCRLEFHSLAAHGASLPSSRLRFLTSKRRATGGHRGFYPRWTVRRRVDRSALHTPHGTPHPPPPGVSIERTSPGFTHVVNLDGSFSRVPSRMRMFDPAAPCSPPCKP